jgi:hypothetical protein
MVRKLNTLTSGNNFSLAFSCICAISRT